MSRALQACQSSGIKIPAEVALAGFDDTVWTTLVQPNLTVIAQPTDEIGKTAMELLLRRIENPEQPYRTVTLRGQLVVRESSGG